MLPYPILSFKDYTTNILIIKLYLNVTPVIDMTLAPAMTCQKYSALFYQLPCFPVPSLHPRQAERPLSFRYGSQQVDVMKSWPPIYCTHLRSTKMSLINFPPGFALQTNQTSLSFSTLPFPSLQMVYYTTMSALNELKKKEVINRDFWIGSLLHCI